MNRPPTPPIEPDDSISKALATLWPKGWEPESIPRSDWVPITCLALPKNRAEATSWIKKEVNNYGKNKQITSGKGVRDHLDKGAEILERMIKDWTLFDLEIGTPGMSELFKQHPKSSEIPRIPVLLVRCLEAVKKASEANPSKTGAGASTIGPFSELGIERTPEMSFCEWLWILWFAVQGLPEMQKPGRGVSVSSNHSDFQKFLSFAWGAASYSAKRSMRRMKHSPTLPSFGTLVQDHAFHMHRYLCERVEILRGSA